MKDSPLGHDAASPFGNTIVMTAAPSRISLAEVSRTTGALMRRGDPTPLGPTQEQPRLADITECLFFSPGDGRIWLNDQRMVLMHTSALGTLRRELIDSDGLERARGLLTRAGYESGSRDAPATGSMGGLRPRPPIGSWRAHGPLCRTPRLSLPKSSRG